MNENDSFLRKARKTVSDVDWDIRIGDYEIKFPTGTYRGQLQVMTRGQFDKTPEANSVIYKCSYRFQTQKQWLHL